ncbi:MAG: adenylate/guanylate cyclase domain-containing protein [Cyanobacteria bacterium SBC]|nr:adenylate/guanylate cyclase domain-containing protein [Cyanobacteria bacterium SBC]
MVGQRFRTWLWQWRGVAISVPCVTLVLAVLRGIGWLQPLELAAYDALLRSRLSPDGESRVAIVGITERDMTETLDRPIPSDVELAQLLETIRNARPRAIGLDIYRDLPHPPGTDRLERVFSTTPNLIGIRKLIGRPGNFPVAAPLILSEAGQVGANDVPLDRDGRIRRAYLFVKSIEGETVAGLGLRLAELYLKSEGLEPEATPDDPNTMQLGGARFDRFERHDGGYVRADDSSYQILINYQNTSFDRVSLTDVISGRVSPEFFFDRVVLIGYVAESANDFHLTSIGNIAGVEIQAQIASHIIAMAFGERPAIRTLSEPLEWLWIVTWIAIASILSWSKRHVFEASRVSFGLIAGWGMLGFGVVVAAYFAFQIGWWLPLVPPFLGVFSSAAAIAIYLAAGATQMRRIFGRYLTDEVVTTLLETPEGLNFKCQRQTVTILMSDLRGFSTISERLSPERVVELLDIYLGKMTDIITSYNGTINEFVGDGIVVFFGAPTSAEDDIDRSIACALSMQLAMPEINQKLARQNLPSVQMGIGINTGEVVVGNIGSLKRAKWSVIGTHINLASRIESCTVGGQILISDSTQNSALSDLQIDRTLTIEMKGFEKPILIHEVCGISGRYNLKLPRLEDDWIALTSEIPIYYKELSGKSIDDRMFVGHITKLSKRGAEIRGSSVEELLTNLKIHLIESSESYAGDIYAKVMEHSDRDEVTFYVRFTAETPQLDRLLSKSLQ